jgi:hypothetical protein
MTVLPLHKHRTAFERVARASLARGEVKDGWSISYSRCFKRNYRRMTFAFRAAQGGNLHRPNRRFLNP